MFLIPCQGKARALNEPVNLLEPKVHLVAHPVGFLAAILMREAIRR